MYRRRNYVYDLSNYQVIVISLIALIIGFSLLVWAAWLNNSPNPMLKVMAQPILQTLGSIVMTSGSIGLILDLLLKRNFTDEILEKVRISHQLEYSGIIGITFNPKGSQNGIPWPTLFDRVKEIDIFFMQGVYWRLENDTLLRHAAARKDVTIRFALPNVTNAVTLEHMSTRTGKRKEKIVLDVNDAANYIQSLAASGGASIKLFFTNIDPPYTLYRFDDTVVLAFSSCLRRKGDVPHIIAKVSPHGNIENTIYRFATDQFSEIVEKAQEWNNISATQTKRVG